MNARRAIGFLSSIGPREKKKGERSIRIDQYGGSITGEKNREALRKFGVAFKKTKSIVDLNRELCIRNQNKNNT